MTETQRVKSNGSFLYPGPGGLLVPDSGKAIAEVDGGGGMYMAGAKLERAHMLDIADQAFRAVQIHGLKAGTTFHDLVEEMAGSLSTVNKSNDGRIIGKEARDYILWAMRGGKGDEPGVSDMALATATAFLEWQKKSGFHPEIIGQRFFDERVGYSVEIDAVGTMPGRITTALTIVIGSGIYKGHLLTNAAAVNAANNTLGGVKLGMILRLPRDAEDFDKAPFEVRAMTQDETKKDFERFVLALGLWQIESGWKRAYAEKPVVVAKPRKAAHG